MLAVPFILPRPLLPSLFLNYFIHMIRVIIRIVEWSNWHIRVGGARRGATICRNISGWRGRRRKGRHGRCSWSYFKQYFTTLGRKHNHPDHEQNGNGCHDAGRNNDHFIGAVLVIARKRFGHVNGNIVIIWSGSGGWVLYNKLAVTV